MHEMSIVEALLGQIRQETCNYPEKHVSNVCVRIGALRQVIPETLTFCFVTAVRGTSLDGCRLTIEQLPAEARCRKCSATFHVEENWFQCPRCGELGSELLTGNELELTSLELE